MKISILGHSITGRSLLFLFIIISFIQFNYTKQVITNQQDEKSDKRIFKDDSLNIELQNFINRTDSIIKHDSIQNEFQVILRTENNNLQIEIYGGRGLLDIYDINDTYNSNYIIIGGFKIYNKNILFVTDQEKDFRDILYTDKLNLELGIKISKQRVNNNYELLDSYYSTNEAKYIFHDGEFKKIFYREKNNIIIRTR